MGGVVIMVAIVIGELSLYEGDWDCWEKSKGALVVERDLLESFEKVRSLVI